ncbi:MAG: homoserine dehydrogenase [Bacteroidota bacterium]|nr:homoserine dehydrogenase [Bacteroidota bacterium]MDX5429949.1 homoserine dehydrogenase [Bacteroidota bacterium]MDX5468722.1 homoserine dehydrogenase [Bacteroidota bacterium]
MTKTKEQTIALIGFGCVGSGFYTLQKEYDAIQVRYIVVKDRLKPRNAPTELIHFDYQPAIDDTEVDTIVELIDDAEVAWQIASSALKAGKNVVTANKKMIAARLPELLDLAKKHRGILRFEAAVCGSIPILQTLNNYLNGLDIQSVSGILNGSSNYILSKIEKENLGFAEALRLAQSLGFAEADPTLDIEGFDAAYKLLILSAFAFGKAPQAEEIIRGGISALEYRDLNFARQRQLRLKLLAFAEPKGLAYVLPALVSSNEATYAIDQEYNIALVESEQLGLQSYVGKGAGSIPTGKAVLEDVMAVRRGEAYQLELSSEKSVFEGDIEVYFRFPGLLPPEIEWVEQKEIFTSSLINYVVGKVRPEGLRTLASFLSKPGYFLAVFPSTLQERSPEYQEQSCSLSL